MICPVGAQRVYTTPCPYVSGRDAEGIHYAMSFLESWQKKQASGNAGGDVSNDLKLLAKDKHVIVVGGGDTGVDCIATALRQVCDV